MSIGQGVTPTTAPNTIFVSITVHESPTTNSFALVRSRPTLYVKLGIDEPSRKSVNLCTLIALGGGGDMADVAIPLESIQVISEGFAYTNLCFKDELDAMLENGPWFIRNNPFILKKWNPDVNLQKEDVGNVLVWVKLYSVSMTAFSEDGLSILATKLGTPLMLESYTSDVCTQSWGRSSYARAMIELRADEELKDTIMAAMPKLVGEGFNMCTIRIEYEWKPQVFELQANRGVPVGPNVSSKSTKPIYRHVSNKNDANTSGNKKQAKVSRQEVSNSKPFDALNSIENNNELVTNEGIQVRKSLPKVLSTVNANSDS
ncbi:reverse transcriptase domain-containing protein [Tanacetum coccineum]